MEKMELSGKYLMDIPQVDEQHGRLVEMLNNLNEVIEEKWDESEVFKIVDDFVAYTHYHFGDEEKLMREEAYPHLEEHAQIHRAFVQQVEKTIVQYSGTKFLRFKFFQIGMNILMNHIETEDYKFSQFLKDKSKV